MSLIRGLNEELHAVTTAAGMPDVCRRSRDREGKPFVPGTFCRKSPQRLLDGASIYNPEDTDYEDNRMVLERPGKEASGQDPCEKRLKNERKPS